MEKTLMDIKSTSARNAGISGRRKRGGRSGGPERKITPHVRSAAKLLSCTTIRSITATTAAVTKSAATLSSCQSLRPSRPHPCPSCLENRLQADALSCPCNPHGSEHVLLGQEFIPQYCPYPAYCDECPGLPHHHQQLVHQVRAHVPEYRLAAHSSPEFQLG